MASEERFVTRNPGFIQIPNDLWEARTEGGMEACHDAEVYGWLWRFGHGSDHGYYGTVAKLAAVAHIKERHVRQSLRRLELAGFITRTERLGTTSLYRTHIEPTCAPRTRTNPLPHGAPPASRGTPPPPAPQGTPPPASRGTPTPCPVRPPKQEPKNKNPENKKKANSPQPAAAVVRDREPEQPAKRKANPSRLLITADDLPLDLLGSAVADYVTWWNKVRQGQCTERTLKAELNQLRKIAADPAGGIAAVEAQIRQALEKADLGGKRWSAITHANWQRYGVDRRTQNGPSARIAEARRVSEAFGGRNPLHVYGEARQAGIAAQIDLIQPVTIAEIR